MSEDYLSGSSVVSSISLINLQVHSEHYHVFLEHNDTHGDKESEELAKI